MVVLLHTMIHNRHLPLWLHRICNGVFGAALLIGMGSIWFGESPGSWQYVLSRGLIWASIPVGIILAVMRVGFALWRDWLEETVTMSCTRQMTRNRRPGRSEGQPGSF